MDGRRVGVLGGGQLGRMMAEAGHRLGIQLAVLDPGTRFVVSWVNKMGWGGLGLGVERRRFGRSLDCLD